MREPLQEPVQNQVVLEHKLGYNLTTGQDWCIPCDTQYPCRSIQIARRHDTFAAALRAISEMETILDAREYAHATLRAAGLSD